MYVVAVRRQRCALGVAPLKAVDTEVSRGDVRCVARPSKLDAPNSEPSESEIDYLTLAEIHSCWGTGESPEEKMLEVIFGQTFYGESGQSHH
jgi:hypothetical protein